VLLGGYALDLDAMILSLPRAIFPALAISVYHAGAAGLGLLYASTGVGAVAGSFLSGFIRHLRHPGRAVLFAVAGWGVAITALALAGFSLWLALVFLAFAGAADAISAISRNVIQQTLAPDRLRGRLSAVSSMVVVGGPYLGDARAGALAGILPPEVAILVGGLTCLFGCAVIRALIPQLWHFDIVDATLDSG
jgi:predicted MFS family arabinose efflux permease